MGFACFATHAKNLILNWIIMGNVLSSRTLKNSDASKAAAPTASPLTREAAAFASATSEGPVEVPQLSIEPRQTSDFAIKARILSPSTYSLVVTRVPRVFLANNQPLEIHVSHAGSHSDASTAACLARSISAHARLALVVETKTKSSVKLTVETFMRPTNNSDGWVVRAQLCPASWANAASVSVASLTIADRPVPCSLFPASVRVGFNHASVAAGAVLAAAKAGDVTALQAALEGGGSTEEADKVCEEREKM